MVLGFAIVPVGIESRADKFLAMISERKDGDKIVKLHNAAENLCAMMLERIDSKYDDKLQKTMQEDDISP